MMKICSIKNLLAVSTWAAFALALSVSSTAYAHGRGHDHDGHSDFKKTAYDDHGRHEGHDKGHGGHEGHDKGKHEGHDNEHGGHKGFDNDKNPWYSYHDDDQTSGDDGSGDDDTGSVDTTGGTDTGGTDTGGTDTGGTDTGGTDTGGTDTTGVDLTLTVHDHVINADTMFTVTYNSLSTVQDVLTDLLGTGASGAALQPCYEIVDPMVGIVMSSDCTAGQTAAPLDNTLTLEAAGVVDDPDVHLVPVSN